MLYLPCWIFWPLASTETNNTPAYHIGRPTGRLYVRPPLHLMHGAAVENNLNYLAITCHVISMQVQGASELLR